MGRRNFKIKNSRWLPDSPRWLLSHGDVEGTLNILVQAARKSNLVESLPTNLAFKLKTTQQVRQPPQTRWFKLWSESMFTSLRSLLLHVAFACFTIMFFGMVLNMPNYGRRHLTKSARFIAVSELIGCFIGLVFATKTKHKFLWSGLFNISGAVVAYCVWIWRHRGMFVSQLEKENPQNDCFLSHHRSQKLNSLTMAHCFTFVLYSKLQYPVRLEYCHRAELIQ